MNTKKKETLWAETHRKGKGGEKGIENTSQFGKVVPMVEESGEAESKKSRKKFLTPARSLDWGALRTISLLGK